MGFKFLQRPGLTAIPAFRATVMSQEYQKKKQLNAEMAD
jgi:hypothetical protein